MTLWKPVAVERRQPVDVAYYVDSDFHLYLKRVALNQMLRDDPPWPSEYMGTRPAFEAPDRVAVGYQIVNVGDWLIFNGQRCWAWGPGAFDRAYRKVE